jgi:hypothetical protein
MSQQKNKIIPANKELSQKIGTGSISTIAIERAEEAIQENDVDFAPLGLDFLKKLEVALDSVENKKDLEEQKMSIIKPVMELKANAEIFHYELVGNLANIMLNFIESIETLDKDALAITRSHHDSLKAILGNKMKGNGGQNGKTMITELKDACARYYKKRK